METLRYVAEHAPATVGEVAAGFGEPRGLARTTVLTVMERLRRKGYLSRRKSQGVFRYAPQVAPAEAVRTRVEEFIKKTLGGSVSPLVAYLVESGDLSDEELAALRKLVNRLPERDEETP